jgi:hypothetical protein
MLSFHENETCEGIIQHLEQRERAVMIRNTVAACHAPPLGVGSFRASNSRATARADMPLATHSSASLASLVTTGPAPQRQGLY